MTEREQLHQLVEDLPDGELSVARRVLVALAAAPSGLVASLYAASPDDEADDDDRDGGLTEARQEAEAGEVLSADDVRQELGIA